MPQMQSSVASIPERREPEKVHMPSMRQRKPPVSDPDEAAKRKITVSSISKGTAAVNPEGALLALIYGKKKLYRIKNSDIARAIYVSRNTIVNRMKSPSSFTLGELQHLFKYLNCTKEDLTTLIHTML